MVNRQNGNPKYTGTLKDAVFLFHILSAAKYSTKQIAAKKHRTQDSSEECKVDSLMSDGQTFFPPKPVCTVVLNGFCNETGTKRARYSRIERPTW